MDKPIDVAGPTVLLVFIQFQHQLIQDLIWECLETNRNGAEAFKTLNNFLYSHGGSRATVSVFALMVQKQWWVKQLVPWHASKQWHQNIPDVMVFFSVMHLQSNSQIHLRISSTKHYVSSPLIKSYPWVHIFLMFCATKWEVYTKPLDCKSKSSGGVLGDEHICSWVVIWTIAFFFHETPCFIWQIQEWKWCCHFKENNCSICCQWLILKLSKGN